MIDALWQMEQRNMVKQGRIVLNLASILDMSQSLELVSKIPQRNFNTFVINFIYLSISDHIRVSA